MSLSRQMRKRTFCPCRKLSKSNTTREMRRRMKMEQHVDALEQKISDARAEVKRLEGEIATTQTDLGKLLASDGNDKKADALQVRREELSRAKERGEIRAQALSNEKPAAARLDAQ